MVTTPLVVIWPTELLPLENHNAPSGPVVIPVGSLIPAPVKLATVPVVVMRPMELFPVLVNQRAPSGPVVIPVGWLIPVPVWWVTAPPVVMRPMVLFPVLVNQRAPSG